MNNTEYRIAIITSGKSRGSNFEHIVEYIQKFHLNIRIAFVVVTRNDAPIIRRAQRFGIPWVLFSARNTFESALQALVKEQNCHLIVLAGFMRKLSSKFLHDISIPVINIHPALLPHFGGKKMYGARVHEAVFSQKEKYSGATVHQVTDDYDAGPIIAQEKIDISMCRSPEEIAAKVLTIEHSLYPRVIVNFAKEYLEKNEKNYCCSNPRL